MALIMVIGTASVLGIITAVIAVQSVSNLRQAGNERTFERSLHVADAGVDHMLFLIKQQKQEDQTHLTTGEPAPDASYSPEEERQWALDQADAAVAADPDRLVTTREGDWVAMRPQGDPLIYSVGYVPSFDAPRKIRVVRAEYDFAPFSPGYAILTGGNLRLDGGVKVNGLLPNVHGNLDVNVFGGAGMEIGGDVTASGGYTETGNPPIGNSGDDTPIVEVPEVDPRANYSMSEYDLCPYGEVRAGPNYDDPAVANSSPVPCNGGVLALDGDNFLNWNWGGHDDSQGEVWRYSGNGDDDGVFYIFQGSAIITSHPDGWAVTILAEAVGFGPDEPDCPHTGGDIDVRGGGTMTSNEKGKGLGFVAGRDLKIRGTPGTDFGGSHAAHEQFNLTGTARLNGFVVAENACDTDDPGKLAGPGSDVSGNVSITYDGASVPLGSSIRTTLWLEI